MTDTIKKVAIIGGSRIPFCRSNSLYADQTNLDMLSGSLNGLISKFGLEGVLIDELIAGAVTTHAKDWNLAREALQSTALSPLTPGITLQQACGTSLQAANILAAKIACGAIDSGIAAGTDTASDVPIVFGRKFSQRLVALSRARSLKQRLAAFKGFGPGELKPVTPGAGEPRTGLSMGQHCERMAREWSISRDEQDRLALASHQKAAAAYDAGFFDDLIHPHAGVLRDNNIRADSTIEALGGLRTAFAKDEKATLTAGNSTPLTDGAASVLLGSEDWAKERGLPIQAYLTAYQTSSVDYVQDEGLLMAPAVAVSEMLRKQNLSLQDFDFYEIHEAFAAQVACTLAAWESPSYCKNRLGRSKAMGSIDHSKLNIKGSSLAVGHPFAATGARIIATLGKILEEAGSGRGLISVCTAGGMGVTAIVERP